MARGRKSKINRLRAKRFENEVVKASNGILNEFDVDPDLQAELLKRTKSHVGKMIKRLLETKLLREQEFYIGDWVLMVKDRDSEPLELLDINYNLKTARVKDRKEGEIWVKFSDIVKDEAVFE